MFTALPPVGAWRLLGAYEGFEVVRFAAADERTILEGATVGVEQGVAWSIHYVLHIAGNWHVQRATVSDNRRNRLEIESDDAGSWRVNGQLRPELQGCLDLDFEASVVTNTLPIHRLGLAVGQRGESAAAYIRIQDLAVERLDQQYRRLPDERNELLFEYESPRFGYHDTLHFGPDGLVVTYPGIGARVPLKV
jgi:uncharacterized protein